MKLNSLFKSLIILQFLTLSLSLSYGQSIPKDNTDEEFKTLRQILDGYDTKIKNAFNANPKLKKEMEEQISVISKITNESMYNKAVADYQKKFLKSYQEILSAAKITNASILAELKSKLPDHTWSINSQMEITGSKSEKSAKNGTKATDGKITSTKINFNFTPSTSCALVSGGEAKSTSTSLIATSAATVIGGCSSVATFTKNHNPGTYSAAWIDVSLKRELKTNAIGVPGFAISKASANVFMPGVIDKKEITSMALFLWVTSKTGGGDLNNETYDVPLNFTTMIFSIIAKTKAENFGIGSDTKSSSKITDIAITLNIKQ